MITGKVISFTEKERKILDKKYSTYFGNGKWNGSVRTFYQDFLRAQQQEGIPIEIPDTSFDVYDLAAMAYIYKRIKETDPVREASHVVIDEAQDFGMMVYRCLHYCMPVSYTHLDVYKRQGSDSGSVFSDRDSRKSRSVVPDVYKRQDITPSC